MYIFNLSKEMKRIEQQVFDELMKEFKKKTVIASTFGLSPSAITKWSKKGVPKVRIPYFRLAFPHFKAWKNLH